MTSKAKLEKLEKALTPEPEAQSKFIVLYGSEEKPGIYFEDEMDADREEPLGKVYTEAEAEKLSRDFTVIFLVYTSGVSQPIKE